MSAPRVRAAWAAALMLVLLPVLAASPAWCGLAVDGALEDDHTLSVALAGPLDALADGTWPGRAVVFERTSPDIPLTVSGTVLKDQGRTLVIHVEEALNTGAAYVVELDGLASGGRALPPERLTVRKGALAIVLSILLSAALIHNFVFTRYLGLCIFFGTSGRKETAVGMGVSFTIVMTLSALFIWAVYTFVLRPLHLDFLQVLVFVGIVAIFVQFLDTVLRKVNPFLFKKLGVYLVLITTNCIVLAVPLILVGNAYNAVESLALALGSGAGFALALFLMASVRERLELADIPAPFRGLPIAFIVAGLFALAFLGFSGLSL